jgi:serine/threonine-protein kinase
MARICQRCSHHNEDHAKFCLSCGAMLEVAAAAHQDPLLGKVLLGRYRPVSVLGEGGMGKVYLAEQKMGTATRKVAIKTLHPELGNDPQIVARFHRESETVIELRHPNTIQFYDFGELDDGTLIIVMEYIQGKPLAKVLEEEGAIEPKRAENIVIQICGSLREAHQRGIVHRDLKPENVLLTDQGGQADFVKVLDFGIAKRDDAEDPNQAKLTKQGMVLGTPPYMSPEQFSGQKLDARSDIYSLGVMVYEMLVGKLPFEAATPWEWATKHLTAQPTPMDVHPAAAHVAPNKKMAVMRALAKNRDERQDSVVTFLQEFTGNQDADSAWAMATSAGGGMMSKGGGAPHARPPAPTPGPMHQGVWGQPTPPPQLGSQPGLGMVPGMGSHPGIGSVPGMGSHPGMSNPGMSNPGMSNPGFGSAPGLTPAPAFGNVAPPPSYPGYSTGPQPQAGGGMLGKLLALGLIGLFVLAGGAAGLAWYVSRDDDETTTARNDTPPPTTTPVNVDPGAIMQPADPNVPTTPMQPVPTPGMPVPTPTLNPVPTPPVVPPTPPVTPTPIATPETPPTPEPPRTEPTREREERRPSPADEARARALVAQGMGAARRNDFAGAASSLQQAQSSVGRRHPITQELRNELSRRGSNQVGILLQQGRCGQAQQLYRQLQSVGAAGDARRQFGDWCPI